MRKRKHVSHVAISLYQIREWRIVTARNTDNAGIDRVTDTMIGRYTVIDHHRAFVRGRYIKIDISAVIVFRTNLESVPLVNL